MVDELLSRYDQAVQEQLVVKGGLGVEVRWSDLPLEIQRTLDVQPADTLHLLNSKLQEVYRLRLPDEAERVKQRKHIDSMSVRIKDFPAIFNMRALDSNLLGRFVEISGIITRSSEVQPMIKLAVFRCKNCEALVETPQRGVNLEYPMKCDACRMDKFELEFNDCVFENCQVVSIQENPEDTQDNITPIKMTLRIPAHIVNVARAGDRVNIYGILRPVLSRKTSRICGLTIDVNNVEVPGEETRNPVITEEEMEKIHELSQDPEIIDKIVKSMVPSIYGHFDIKLGIALLLFGGEPKQLADGTRIRGDINMLIIGDPGTAKSVMLKYAQSVSPRGIYAAGKGASGVGLTAAAIKPEGSDHFELEAGALVLANGGICCIDEFDKMNSHDRDNIHEPLAQQTISVNKGGINATLNARCSILAAANPRDGRYNAYKGVRENISFMPTLLSRFDLIWVIKDVPDKEKDSEMTLHILRTHDPEAIMDSPVAFSLLKKYIAVGRRVKTRLNEAAKGTIYTFFMKVRNQSSDKGDNVPMSITARQLESVIRLTEAAARMRLREVAGPEDAMVAIKLLDQCLTQIGFDAVSGEIDIDAAMGGLSKKERDRGEALLEVMKQVMSDTGLEYVTYVDLRDEVYAKLRWNGDTLKKEISKLEERNAVIVPRPNCWKPIT